MSQENIFELIALVKSANGDPSAVVDAAWEAGYRQPERTAEEAAQITIDTFFYCNTFDMPTDFWPRDYDSVLQNELMKAVIGEDGELDGADATTIARSVISAGFFRQKMADDATSGKPLIITQHHKPEVIGYEHRMICGELRRVPKFAGVSVSKVVDYPAAIDLLREFAAHELRGGYKAHHNALIYAANKLENEQSFGKEVKREP